MPRLFVAVGLPESARDRLADLSTGLPGADWVESEQYHLTMRFIGEVDAPAFHSVRDGLAAVSTRSFHFDLRGVGVFPLRGSPETLWAGVPRCNGLMTLRHKVESALGRRGIPAEKRKFFPHVTLARLHNAEDEWVGRYVTAHSLLSIPGIPVQAFHLYSSKLTPHGAVHTLEETYPLEGILDMEGQDEEEAENGFGAAEP
jgi:2'-5' RNA ligase